MESFHPKVDMFAKKYDMYGNMLYKLSFVYLKNKMDCEDVLQEAFIKLVYKSPAFDGPEHEKSWLIRITINLCKDKLKEAWRRKKRTLDEAIYEQHEDEYDNTLEFIMTLPEKMKVPIHLHYYEGYSVKEIARILRISESAVKMRLKRGREILKREITENE